MSNDGTQRDFILLCTYLSKFLNQLKFQMARTLYTNDISSWIKIYGGDFNN